MKACVISGYASSHHRDLSDSGIPPLTRDIYRPKKVVEAATVKSGKPQIMPLNFEKLLPKFEFGSTLFAFKGYFAVEFESDRKDRMKTLYKDNYLNLRINGAEEAEGFPVENGTNCAVFKFDGLYHSASAAVAFKKKAGLKITNVYMAGPFLAKTAEGTDYVNGVGFNNTVDGAALSAAEQSELKSELLSGNSTGSTKRIGKKPTGFCTGTIFLPLRFPRKRRYCRLPDFQRPGIYK
jgi:hypothetical protein